MKICAISRNSGSENLQGSTHSLCLKIYTETAYFPWLSFLPGFDPRTLFVELFRVIQDDSFRVKIYGKGIPFEILAPVAISVEEEHRKRRGKVYDDELWRSCWKTISPLGLLVCRGILFLLMAGLLASDLLVNGLGVLYFYTEWTFTLVTIYFGLATIISMKGCSQWSKHGSNGEHHERTDFLTMDREQGATETSGENLNGNPVTLQSYDEWQENRKKAGFWGFIMQIVFQTCAGAVMLTDIVFWLILVPFLSSKHFRLKLLIGCMHSVNAFSLLIDTALNNMHFTWFRGAYFVLWTTVYIIFQWILHACGFTWWPYPFLELAKPLAPLWYFGLALLCIICYGIFALLIELKGRLFPKWFAYSYQSLHYYKYFE